MVGWLVTGWYIAEVVYWWISWWKGWYSILLRLCNGGLASEGLVYC